MVRTDFLKILSTVSVFTLIIYSPFTYAVCQILLLCFILIRIKSFEYFTERKTLVLALSLLLLFIFPSLIFQSFLIDSTLKVLNFSLLFLVVQKNDTKKMIKKVEWFMYPAILYSLCIYFGITPDVLNTEYEKMYAFGRNANSSIFFEADYAGITAAIIAIYSKRVSTSFSSLGVNFIADYFFGTLAIIGNLFKKILKFSFLKFLAALFVVFTPWALYYLGPIFFEQRYFIWYSYLNNVDLLAIYKPDNIKDLIYTDLTQSPWGLKGLNLHNGFFESISYKGIIYTLFSIILIFKAFFKSKKDIFLILFFIGLYQMFSISLGGLSFPSLVFSFLIIEKLKYAQ